MKLKEPELQDVKNKSELAHALSWYSNEKSKDDAKEYLIEYTEKNLPKYLSIAKRINTNNINPTVAWCARLIQRGYDLPYQDYIESYLSSLKVSKDEEDKPIRKPRMEYDLDEFIGSLEEKVDEYLTSKKPFNINEEFKINHVPLKYHKDIKEWADTKIQQFQKEYETVEIEEEGSVPYEVKERLYSSGITSKHLQRLIVYLTLDEIKKAKKIVKKKKIDSNKQVEKVKYLLNYNDIKSVHPVHIIGSKLCITFNTKYKYICIYKASIPDGLFVKGSSIYNFVEEIGKKILKKPERDLKNFLSLPKEELMSIYESINTKPSKLSGQLNEHTIILRVEQ